MKKSNFKTLMRYWRLSLLSIALILSACDINKVIDSDGDVTATDSFSFEIELAGQSRFRLDGINGNIEVVGEAGRTSALIYGERKVTAERSSDANAGLNELEVVITETDEELRVETEQPRDTRGRNFQINYHVRIPLEMAVELNNSNGNIRVDSLDRGLAVELSNGNVMVGEIAGTTTVELTNGNVVLGHIDGSAITTTVNGNITATVYLPESGTCDLATTNGVINLGIPRETSAEFSAEVTNGAISVAGLSVNDATTSTRFVRGKLRDGKGRVALRTVNGNIRVEGF